MGGTFTKTLGIIGGMGPMATVYFMEMIVKMTDADTDNEHVPMLVCNQTSIPDRTKFMLGRSTKNPLPEILKASDILNKNEVEFISIPCVTAHYFYKDIAEHSRAPVINMVRETAAYLKEFGVKQVGIMATEGTITCSFMQKELEDLGLEVHLPSKKGQASLMNIIYKQVKADKTVDMAEFFDVERELRISGAEVILLGCTELSLIKRDYRIGTGFLDMMELLAAKSLISCGAVLKSEYLKLIT